MFQTYGKSSVFKNLFKSRKGWVKLYIPLGKLDLHEEEE
jgi:hypothetical protein